MKAVASNRNDQKSARDVPHLAQQVSRMRPLPAKGMRYAGTIDGPVHHVCQFPAKSGSPRATSPPDVAPKGNKRHEYFVYRKLYEQTSGIPQLPRPPQSPNPGEGIV